MKKNTVKIIIASLLIAAVGAVGGMGISACINNSQKAPEQTIVATEKAEKKNSDSDKTKETKVETQAPTVKATVKPTVKPTQAPTQKPTQAPTQNPTQKPAPAPTQKPTEKPAPAPTQAPTVAPTQAPTQAPTKPATPDEASKLYTVLKNTIKDSKAQGYMVVSLKGTDAKVLVLTFGKEEAKKSFKFYTIGKKDVTSVGKLSAANVTAYTDKESGKLCLYTNKDGEATYNAVKLEKDTVKLTAMTDNTVGKAVKFLPTNDFTDLDQFK